MHQVNTGVLGFHPASEVLCIGSGNRVGAHALSMLYWGSANRVCFAWAYLMVDVVFRLNQWWVLCLGSVSGGFCV